jgi:hypothetical protein
MYPILPRLGARPEELHDLREGWAAGRLKRHAAPKHAGQRRRSASLAQIQEQVLLGERQISCIAPCDEYRANDAKGVHVHRKREVRRPSKKRLKLSEDTDLLDELERDHNPHRTCSGAMKPCVPPMAGVASSNDDSSTRVFKETPKSIIRI